MKMTISGNTKTMLLGLITLVFLTISCKKDNEPEQPTLPAATQQGLDTFGCLVDGQLWLPYVQDFYDSKVEAKYFVQLGGTFNLRAEQEPKSGAAQYVHLTIKNNNGVFLKPGTYTAANGFEGKLEVYSVPELNYVSSAAGVGKVVITKVEPQVTTTTSGTQLHYAIVSGTFEFEATDAKTGKTVRLTEGRFDVKAK